MINCLAKLGAIAGTATVLVHSALAADNAEMMTWKVDGQTRRAIVYRPSAISGGKAPLVLSFHGRGDNIQNFQFTNMHLAWPEAIVVYFQGLPTRGGLFGWQTEKDQDDDRDLRLVDVALGQKKGRPTFRSIKLPPTARRSHTIPPTLPLLPTAISMSAMATARITSTTTIRRASLFAASEARGKNQGSYRTRTA